MKISTKTCRNMAAAAGVLLVGSTATWAVVHPEETVEAFKASTETVLSVFRDRTPPICMDTCPACGMG